MRLLRLDPDMNMARFYELDIQPNLLGGYSLIRNWGRIGTKGQLMVNMFAKIDDARFLRDQLLRQKKKRGYRTQN